MTIVYTVGSGSKHNDAELKWSLRSIALNGRGIDAVAVVGHVPDFVNRDTVRCIPMDEPSDPRKHVRIFRKMQAACSELSLDGEFLWSSDDHFYVKETYFSSYPVMASDWTLPTDAELDAVPLGKRKWRRSLALTGDMLAASGVSRENTQGHFNTLMDARHMADIERFASLPSARFPLGPHPSVISGNLKLTYEPGRAPGLVKVRDAKIGGNASDSHVRDVISRSSVISCGDRAMESSEFVSLMDGMFGKECRYER